MTSKTRAGRKPDQARREMVVRLREGGMTFTAIGQSMHPQVTRQAAREMFLSAKKPVDKENDAE